MVRGTDRQRLSLVSSYDRDTYLGMLASESSYTPMQSGPRIALLEGVSSFVDACWVAA